MPGIVAMSGWACLPKMGLDDKLSYAAIRREGSTCGSVFNLTRARGRLDSVSVVYENSTMPPHRHRQFKTIITSIAVLIAGLLVATPWSIGAGPEKEKATEKNADAEAQSEPDSDEKPRGKAEEKIVKTDAEWRKILTREQFRVTRRKGTETPYKGAYWKTKKDGIYQCLCCGQPLFDSSVKFDSKTGWPSFWEPIEKEVVSYHEDRSQREVRTEVQCSRCDAHLGHVFNDGPPPTGQRFCMNSVALKWVARPKPAAKETKPQE